MFEPSVYADRRARLGREVGSGLLLLIGHADSPMNYAANAYRFRQDSTFLYFFGLDLPDLAATIDAGTGRVVIYGDDFTMDDIVWRGPQPTIASLASRAGVAETAPRRVLAEEVASALRQGRTVHLLPQFRAENALLVEHLTGIRAAALSLHVSVPFIKAVVAQRAVKSPAELAQIEEALDTTREMHLLAMRQARPGRYEREVAGAMQGVVTARDVSLAFPIIFSVHGETLHNHDHSNRMEAGQMAVNDSGAESKGRYAADITRTIPIGGTFTGLQRDFYLSVLKAQEASIAAVRPGVTFREIHLLACQSLASDLKALGFMRGDVAEAVEAGAHAMFFQCGLGHMMGLDVHDMEGLGEQYVGYDTSSQRSTQFGLKSLRMARALEPGFVMTVEPGIYVIPALIDRWKAEGRFGEYLDYEAIERIRGFGGIRIEDNVVVTDAGHRVLGAPIPKAIDEVEAIASR